MEAVSSRVSEFFAAHGLMVYLGVVILAGFYLIVRTMRWVRIWELRSKQLLRRSNRMEAVATESPLDDPVSLAKARGMDSIEHLATVNQKVVVPVILALVLLFLAVPFIGRVPATMVSILVAIITVTLGVAARPIIENAMAGLVISSSKLLNIGDTVKMHDHYGTVEDITVTHTTIKIWDWRRFVVPNNQVMQASIINYSVFDQFLWAHVEFTVSYDVDLRVVEDIAVNAAKSSEHFSPYEEPTFWVMELQKEGILCWIAAWADTPSDSWTLQSDVRKGLITGFQQHNIATHLSRVEFHGPPPPVSRPVLSPGISG